VTVRANERTGLTLPDVFLFGNLAGDTGDGAAAPFRVTALDLSAVKRALNTTPGVTGRFDFNRDGKVNALDLSAVRGSLNRSLAAPAGATQVQSAPTAAAVPSATRITAASVPSVWDEVSGEPPERATEVL
jgi:hypothetical protein